MAQVTGAYLDGIAEGRAFLKANPNLTHAEIKTCMENAAANMRRHAFAMKDCYKGQRDFWRYQIERNTLRECLGVTIYPCDTSVDGMRYCAHTKNGLVRADTLAGIKELIKYDLK